MSQAYRYCGLILASALPLPELPSAGTEEPPALEILIDTLPAVLPDEVRRGAVFAHNRREVLWWLEGIGHVLMSADGRQVRVEPAANGDVEGLRLMMLHPLMALASVMRGDWLLNAAAVERDGQVFAFIGPSASGKSTAAALLLRRGFRLVSDSLLRLTPTADGGFLAHPQASWLQLWPDSLKRLAIEDSELTPVRAGLGLQRWSRAAVTQPLPLARIGLLREQRGNDLEDFVPSRRPGSRGVETLLAHTAGSTWLEDLADRRALFHWAVVLKARVPLESLEMPWGWGRVDALGEQLAAWCKNVPTELLR